MDNSKLQQIAQPDLFHVLEETKRDISTSLNCVNIGEIVTFDAATQTASVRLLLKQTANIAPDGTRTLVEHPVLLDLPVFILFGGVSFMSMPIAPGDSCIVLFNDREIDEWYVNGGVQTPQTFRQHDISDGIALVGINSLQKSIADYIANGVRLSYNAGSRITFTDGLIHSVASLLMHSGSMLVTQNLEVGGNATVDGDLFVGGNIRGVGGGAVNSDVAINAASLHAGNGATGTFGTVNVVNGIVLSGS